MKTILLILFAFVSLAASAQYVPIGTPMQYQKVRVERSLKLPNEIGNLNAADSGAIAFKDGCIYVWMKSTWFKVACPDSTDITNPPLVITSHPSDQTKVEGASVTFSVTASGGKLPYAYQWQKNSVNISGATSANYTFTTTSTSGGDYRAVVTDAASTSVTSNAATLTITAPLLVQYGYYSTDPYTTLMAGTDTLTYAGTFSITNGASISVPFPEAANDKYWVVKVPSTQSVKSTWFNTSFNYGDIPDQVWQTSFVSGSYRYYVTRVPAVLDSSQPVILQN